MKRLRIAFAGDRDISVWILEFLLGQGIHPLALLVADPGRASHADKLITLCPFLDPKYVLVGKDFRESSSQRLLKALDLDYIIGIHFPYLVPPEILAIPKIGVLNLHPAYLPYNRGWHTPSWAILESTPIGATLHFMDAGIDTGDIVHQKELIVQPDDTADTLYQRLKPLELETFKEAWPLIVTETYERRPQDIPVGTQHQRKELLRNDIQRLYLDEAVPVAVLLQRLRALTTNKIEEAAFFEVDGKRYRVQVRIQEEKSVE